MLIALTPPSPRFSRALWAALATAAPLLVAVSQTPSTDSLRRRFVIPLIPTIEVAASASRSTPGSSSGSPSGFGASWGEGFIGLSYQGKTRYEHVQDGAVAAGFGLGNARDLIGAEITLVSVSTFRRRPGAAGTASVRLHRVFRHALGLSVGVENLAAWGTTDGGRSGYAVGSKVMHLRQREGDPFGSVTVNLGVGNGRFRREHDVTARRQALNLFTSVGLRVTERASAVADWTGQDLTLALSLAPFHYIPLIITPGVADVTQSAGDGPRFTLGVGMGFKFGGIRDMFSGKPREDAP